MFLTVPEVAEKLRMNRDTIERHIRAGRLKASKLGDAPNSPYRIDEADLQEFLSRGASWRTQAAAS